MSSRTLLLGKVWENSDYIISHIDRCVFPWELNEAFAAIAEGCREFHYMCNNTLISTVSEKFPNDHNERL
jgi:hypothetical protein